MSSLPLPAFTPSELDADVWTTPSRNILLGASALLPDTDVEFPVVLASTETA